MSRRRTVCRYMICHGSLQGLGTIFMYYGQRPSPTSLTMVCFHRAVTPWQSNRYAGPEPDCRHAPDGRPKRGGQKDCTCCPTKDCAPDQQLSCKRLKTIDTLRRRTASSYVESPWGCAGGYPNSSVAWQTSHSRHVDQFFRRKIGGVGSKQFARR